MILPPEIDWTIWRIPSTADPHLGSLTEVTETWSYEDLMQAHEVIDAIETARSKKP